MGQWELDDNETADFIGDTVIVTVFYRKELKKWHCSIRLTQDRRIVPLTISTKELDAVDIYDAVEQARDIAREEVGKFATAISREAGTLPALQNPSKSWRSFSKRLPAKVRKYMGE